MYNSIVNLLNAVYHVMVGAKMQDDKTRKVGAEAQSSQAPLFQEIDVYVRGKRFIAKTKEDVDWILEHFKPWE